MADLDSPQDLYAKKLRQTFGYPLRCPEPKPGLPESYAENGLQIGDVGYVDEDGMFIVRFNICSTLDHDLHQTKRKDLVGLVNLSAFDPNETLPVLNAFPSNRVICHGIRSSQCEAGADNMKHTKKFMPCSTSGAILILPSGALRQKLDRKKEDEFRRLAEKHALRWCRSVECASLYLITGFYKTSSWHLASFHDARPTEQVLLECDNTGRYTWDPTCDYRQSPGENHNQNQTVLISGFKIQVREWPGDSHVWIDRLPLNSNTWSSLSFYASFLLHILKWVVLTLWDHATSGSARVDRVPATLSQPFHPSDVINDYLLQKNRNVQVAITHDSEWLSMLEDNEISYEDMVEREQFWALLEERYTDDPDSIDVVYLRRKILAPDFAESGSKKAGSSGLSIRNLVPSTKTFSHPPVNDLDVRRFVITHMRLENSVACIKRVPVGFYVLVQFNETKIWSKCTPASLSYAGPLDSIVEWDDEIILPTDLAAEVEFLVYASFEFEPILGNGEMLYTVKSSVDSLARLGKMYFPWHAKNTSSDASLLVTLEERQFGFFLRCWTRGSINLRDEDCSFAEVSEVTGKGHNALLRFHNGQGAEELEECIEYYGLALKRCPLDRDYYAITLCNYATAKFINSQVHGVVSDLDAAIASCYKALSLCSCTHPDQPRISLLLAQTLLYCEMKVQRKASVTDEIKRLAMDVRKICSESSYNYQAATLVLQTLRRYQISVFDSFAKSTRHNEFISELEWSAHVRSWCLDRPYRLVNLSIALRRQFEVTDHLAHLENSISAMNEAMEHIPDGHYDEPWIRASLGDALRVRFLRCGVISDLDAGIAKLEEAVKAIPDQYFDRPWMLASLGNALRLRFIRSGDVADLDSAIFMIEDAVSAISDGHFNKSWILASLGKAFHVRFIRYGDIADLETAISKIKEAVEVIPDDHFDKPWTLASLCDVLHSRFARNGLAEDLDNAILMLEKAVERIPDGYFDRVSVLASLSDAFHVRFVRRGVVADLNKAISFIENAMKLTPDGSDKPGCLSNLGNALRARFNHLGEVSDLQDAISRLRNAVELTPNQHPHKPARLNNLGNALRTRFDRLGEVGDLQDAISRFRDAIELTPDQHPHKPGHLNNLGTVLQARFDRLGEVGDLQDAILRLRDAVELTPDQHPHKPSRLSSLGNALRTRFDRLGEASDLEEAIASYSASALSSTGPAAIRLEACHHWAKYARVLVHHSLLHAYAAAISILPQVEWAGLSLTDPYRELIKGTDIVREAAAAALDSGLPETAVEWLEQGRSIVLGVLYQLHNSYDGLLGAHPDHAHRLQLLSAELEHASVAHENLISLLSEKIQRTEDTESDLLQKQADRHRDLVIERDKLLQEIRRFPGFERFLLQKEFSRLCASAHTGPVVILNAAEKRCDALIILADMEEVIHVPLPKFTPGRSTGLQNSLKTLLGPARGVTCDEEREGKANVEWKDRKWASMLSVLWNHVVKPVLEVLAFSTPGDLSRIFWCPTGPFTFLPIHAAGLYGIENSEPGHKVSDFVVSSYIPTLNILASPESDTITRENVCLLTIPQPASDGQMPLPGVDIEMQHIRDVISDCEPGRISLTESGTGTVEETLSLMRQSDWVHFACHGVQDDQDPTTSGLCLANGRRLKVSDIVSLSRPHGGLAFLSACQTAISDERLSDEAIHIAAGMLFAGYGGVIGSVWSISDRLAPEVAKDVYKQLCQDDAVPYYRNAARALHDAVARLRDNGESFSGWLPFIHVGL